LFKLLMMSGGSGSDNDTHVDIDNNWVQMPNHDDQLPLHLLCLSNNDSHSGNIRSGNSHSNTPSNVNVNTLPPPLQVAQMLVRAYPESASVPDPTTALMPFMSAAVSAASTTHSNSTNSTINSATTTTKFWSFILIVLVHYPLILISTVNGPRATIYGAYLYH
jgi:hypothetical protein